MPANKFENQVQHIMEDLKLPPSPLAWKNIEEQINRKKDRRRIIFWICFLFLILSGGLWLIVGTGNRETILQNRPAEASHVKTELKKIEPPLNNKNSNNGVGLPQNHQKKETSPATVNQTGRGSKIPGTKRAATTFRKKPGNPHSIVASNKRIRNDNSVNAEQLEKDSMPTNEAPQNNRDLAIDEPKLTETPLQIEPQSSSGAKQFADSIAQSKLVSAGQVNPKDAKKSRNNPWKKEVIFDAGWSNYDYGFLSGGSASRFANSGSSNPSTGGFSGIPQKATMGAQFAIGFEFSRPITRRLELNVGLSYHYFSTHLETGSAIRRDSVIMYNATQVAISQYYGNGNQQDYVNRFHVLEIPVSLQYKLSKDLPFTAGIGISYGRLLKTNALSYDPQSNIYYINRKNVTSNYMSISSSVQYTWINKSKFQISSGPFISYSFSKLLKADYHGSPHLLSIGLRSAVKF